MKNLQKLRVFLNCISTASLVEHVEAVLGLTSVMAIQAKKAPQIPGEYRKEASELNNSLIVFASSISFEKAPMDLVIDFVTILYWTMHDTTHLHLLAIFDHIMPESILEAGWDRLFDAITAMIGPNKTLCPTRFLAHGRRHHRAKTAQLLEELLKLFMSRFETGVHDQVHAELGIVDRYSIRVLLVHGLTTTTSVTAAQILGDVFMSVQLFKALEELNLPLLGTFTCHYICQVQSPLPEAVAFVVKGFLNPEFLRFLYKNDAIKDIPNSDFECICYEAIDLFDVTSMRQLYGLYTSTAVPYDEYVSCFSTVEDNLRVFFATRTNQSKLGHALNSAFLTNHDDLVHKFMHYLEDLDFVSLNLHATCQSVHKSIDGFIRQFSSFSIKWQMSYRDGYHVMVLAMVEGLRCLVLSRCDLSAPYQLKESFTKIIGYCSLMCTVQPVYQRFCSWFRANFAPAFRTAFGIWLPGQEYSHNLFKLISLAFRAAGASELAYIFQTAVITFIDNQIACSALLEMLPVSICSLTVTLVWSELSSRGALNEAFYQFCNEKRLLSASDRCLLDRLCVRAQAT